MFISLNFPHMLRIKLREFKIPYLITEHSTDFLDGKFEKKTKKNSFNFYLLKKFLNSRILFALAIIKINF